jgi:hypothetical protein
MIGEHDRKDEKTCIEAIKVARVNKKQIRTN